MRPEPRISSLFRVLGLTLLGMAVPKARAEGPRQTFLPKSLSTPACFVRRPEAGGGTCFVTFDRSEPYHGSTNVYLRLESSRGMCDELVGGQMDADAPHDAILDQVDPKRMSEVAARYDLSQECVIQPLVIKDEIERECQINGVTHHLRRNTVSLDDGRQTELSYASEPGRWFNLRGTTVTILRSPDGSYVARGIGAYDIADLKVPPPPPPPAPPLLTEPIRELIPGTSPMTAPTRCLGWESKTRSVWIVHRPDECVDAGGEVCPDEARLERIGPGKGQSLLLGQRGTYGEIDKAGAARAKKALAKVDQGCIAHEFGPPVVNGVTIEVKLDESGRVSVLAGKEALDVGQIDLGEPGTAEREGLGPMFWNPSIPALVIEVQKTNDRGDSQRYIYADLTMLGLR